MLKEDHLVGGIVIYRQEVRPFSEKQIELVRNFARQVVIAIENARLLNELRQRTDDLTVRTTDLTEALEQQTATSEVLQVISSSPGDLEPVFATMLGNAARICDAKFGNIFRWDGDAMHLVATHNTPPAFAEYRKRRPLPLKPNLPFGRLVEAKAVVHCADAAALPAYTEQRDPDVVAAVELGGIRTFVAVPMLTENKLIGALIVYRQDVRPFTDKQIELVKNFAAQAVIAIENARLLNELRQSLEQQTATSQVLQVISSSPSDLQHVFATILENATRICEAKFGALYLNEGDGFRATAMHNATPDYEEARAAVVHPPPSTSLWRAANTKRPSQITDITSEPGYAGGDPFIVSAVALGGYRSVLSVPMLHEGELVGVITIFRQEVRSFSETHVSLVENFAAQAVIAIENARLLNDLRERTQQLEAQSQEVEKLNQQLEQRVADQVGEIERMGRLRRFLPPQVADLIVASGSEKQLESHRREITALFCDLRGFTGFTESADAEDVMALLRDYHAAIGEIIIKYNGTLERYAGDGVMVVFNDPVPVENPALQAVLMALEVRDAIGALTETWRRWGHDIGFGIGIAHGFATLGTIGFEGRFDYAAIGTVSNVASRLCDEAKPGQILISPRVLTKVENAVKVEPVGEFELKGIRRPLAAYNVVGPSRSNED
jgi:GAF domain-containing protein